MDKLPLEILVEVLRFIPLPDRLDCALISRRWAQAMSMPMLLEDVWPTIQGSLVNAARAVFLKSHRQYRNLRLFKVELSKLDLKLWAKLSKNVRELELDGCHWTPRVLHEILRKCSRLESLKIINLRVSQVVLSKYSMTDLRLFEDASHEAIRASLSNVRRLHLSGPVSVKLVYHLLRSMPNVTSISLGKFKIYGERYEFFELISPYLQELSAFSSMNTGFFESVCNCTNLRRVSLLEELLVRDLFVTDLHLRELLSNNPNLEVFELLTTNRGPIEEETRDLIHGLPKLRELALRLSRNYFTNEFLSGLGRISTLRCLDLGDDIVDAEAFRTLAKLSNLHTLRLSHLHSECLDSVIENLKNLRELDLGDCEFLKDADFAKLKHLSKLRSFALRKSETLTRRTFKGGLGPATLESLKLVSHSLTDADLANIAAHHRRLRSFTLVFGSKVTISGMLNFLRRESFLRELAVILNYEVIYGFLEKMGKLCPQLRVLRLPSFNTKPRYIAPLLARRPMVRVTSMDQK